MADLSDHYSYHRTTAADDDLYGWLLELSEGPAWMKQARCRGLGNDMFYPPPGMEALHGSQIKLLCFGCPVREECLEYAMDDTEGWWAGTSPRDRRRLRKQRRNNARLAPPQPIEGACGTENGFWRHKSLDEDPCGRCTAAHSAHIAQIQWTNPGSTRETARRARYMRMRGRGWCDKCAAGRHPFCRGGCVCTTCFPGEDAS